MIALKEKLGVRHPQVAKALTTLGRILEAQAAGGVQASQAELLLRESLAIWETRRPDDWNRFNTQSLLGVSLIGQKKFAEAEPLILSGYDGIKACAAKDSARKKSVINEAGQLIVRLYEAWGKTEEVAAWQAKLKPPDGQARPTRSDGGVGGGRKR